jgi:membrane-associated protein
MNYKVFILYNLVGGALWAVGLTALGYFLGSTIPGVDKYLFPIVLMIIILSMLPGIIAYLKSMLGKKKQQ